MTRVFNYSVHQYTFEITTDDLRFVKVRLKQCNSRAFDNMRMLMDGIESLRIQHQLPTWDVVIKCSPRDDFSLSTGIRMGIRRLLLKFEEAFQKRIRVCLRVNRKFDAERLQILELLGGN